MVDAAATRLVQKYQSSCQQLAAQHQAPKTAQNEAAIKKVGELLRQDAAVRHEFVGEVATPIVDKMIVCGDRRGFNPSGRRLRSGWPDLFGELEWRPA
jgi:hypothetical protein